MSSEQEPWLSSFKELVGSLQSSDFEGLKSYYKFLLEDPEVISTKKTSLFRFLKWIKLESGSIYPNLSALELLDGDQISRKSIAESIMELYDDLIPGISQNHPKSIHDLLNLTSRLLSSLQSIKRNLPKTFSNIQSDI